MPFVRIFHSDQSKDPSFPAALSQGVHRALVSAFNIPEADFFQVVTGHKAGAELLGPEEFLTIPHSDNLVFVQISCAEGRTTEQKKALYGAIAENISNDTSVLKADVIVNLVETKRENWSFGNGLAPFA